MLRKVRNQVNFIGDDDDCWLLADDQWLEFDVGPPTLITGVVTKGRGDGGKKHWVTRYRVSYSNDSRLWHFYKDEQQNDIKVSVRKVKGHR